MAVDSDAVICEGEESCEKGSESESDLEEYVKAPIGRIFQRRILFSSLQLW